MFYFNRPTVVGAGALFGPSGSVYREMLTKRPSSVPPSTTKNMAGGLPRRSTIQVLTSNIIS
jgi:hypothetical protein